MTGRGKCAAAAGLAAAVWLGAAVRPAAAEGRDGFIQFSDGDEVAGRVYPGASGPLKIHGRDGLRTIEFSQIQEMRLTPRREQMERRWRFIEAGRTEKEFFGRPYPVRHLETAICLAGEAAVTGHLYTTSFVVETTNETRKVVLKAKQRGAEGTSWDDLVYPARIVFAQAAGAAAGNVRIAMEGPVPEGLSLAAMTLEGLVRLDGRQTGPRTWELPSPLGARIFVGAMAGESQVWVGWPQAADEATLAAVSRSLADARDFFDVKTLMAAHRPSPDTIYSLILLSRAGATTLEQEKNRPWRLGVWRWKEGEDQSLMLAGQGYLFRGLTAPGGSLPAVTVRPDWWREEPAGELTLWGIGE